MAKEEAKHFMKKILSFALLFAIIALTVILLSSCDINDFFKIFNQETTKKEESTVVEPITEYTVDPVSEPASEQISEPTSEPISEFTSKTTSDPISEPVSETVNESTYESTSKPLPESTNKSQTPTIPDVDTETERATETETPVTTTVPATTTETDSLDTLEIDPKITTSENNYVIEPESVQVIGNDNVIFDPF